MKLLRVVYQEFVGEPKEWILDEVELGSKNLIVGRNSTGKSRTLAVIGSLARTLSGVTNILPGSCRFKSEFESEGGDLYLYEYALENAEVCHEKLTINDKVYLDRGEGGFGTMLFEAIGGGEIVKFQTPVKEFALVKRRDATQHSFIEPLYQWAAAVRHYYFGTNFGKDQLAVFTSPGSAVDERDANQVVGVFRNGKREFKDVFAQRVSDDMRELGYQIESVDIGFPTSVPPEGLPPELQALRVKETGVNGFVDQLSLSQGMYRVLALLTHMNFLQLRRTSTCVIIDDIGEGLDYDRSCKLIKILRRKAEESNIQVIMSTNDKFVMNSVPLKEWTVLTRNGSHVIVHNYKNSKEKFDDFRFTGLSNFSFFEMDYVEESEDE
ncbi:Predicted ATPase [Pseudomonas putida]|uniref:AAA family ATPase n=1 Tax=Pseudomonas asiatica TaxID=2219225 RepID=UPI0010C0E8EF|nr:AAA family ATPase [Pseudomonas asiatica]CAB5637015.1 Predicted ATPase [Pseudomonas putida]MBA6111544.1 ATP-binding protein [Pseudomonas asiatica]WPU60253.1 AAA family ATPase [Pseudomonas asiatica]CAB5712633.1 Predicted ATPase [Pseudomonas putida]CAB5720758.1 Predicted ATPase [Pseudomonas putida]